MVQPCAANVPLSSPLPPVCFPVTLSLVLATLKSRNRVELASILYLNQCELDLWDSVGIVLVAGQSRFVRIFRAVVEIYQSWSGPCRAIQSTFKRIYFDNADSPLKFYTADATAVPELKAYVGSCEPVFILYKVAAAPPSLGCDISSCIAQGLRIVHGVGFCVLTATSRCLVAALDAAAGREGAR